MRKWLLSLALGLCLLPGARADEGMWLIQCLDRALEKNMKARGLKLGVQEIYNEQAGGLSDAIVSLGFYCTGSMISADGLLLTNHHCAYSQIAGLSTPEHNYLEDGFWALSREQEIPLSGETFYFLNKVLDVTEEVESLKKSLEAEGKPFGSRRIAALMNRKYQEEYGLEAGLESMWSGTRYYMCLYTKYTDIRLVGAPPVTVAAFGGDEDNWEWPQHKADFALYRIYTDDGEPLHPKRHLGISRKGYKEGSFAMVMGYPAVTARYTSAAEMELLFNWEYPEENRMNRQQMEVLRKWMDADPSIRMKYANYFFSLSNRAELRQGESDCMRRFGIVEARRAEERALRAASADNARLLDLLDAEYASISATEQQKMYYRTSLIRCFPIVRTLLRMGSAKDVEAQRKALAEGLAGSDARPEKELLACSLREFLTHMEPRFLKPVHTDLTARFGSDYPAMASWLWDRSCLADMGKKPDAEVVAQYQGGIAEDPLYRYVHDLGMGELNDAEVHVAPLSELKRDYVHARYRYREARGEVQYPDANSTLRLSYGRVLPLYPRDGVYAHWQSTALGLRQKYNPASHDFAYPASFREVLPPPDFPVNFLTDLDITGGNSGSPVLDARGRLIGLAFDGNKESLSSQYAPVAGYNMCVCVDIRYILWVIRCLGKQEYVLRELGV